MQANIHSDMTTDEVEAAELTWNSARSRLARDLEDRGESVEHSDWDWRNKATGITTGEYRVFGLEVEGEFQGLIALSRTPKISPVLPDMISIPYVEYLEAAPWNLKPEIQKPKFLGVGSAMLAQVVKISFAMGCGGRIGLHALSSACDFYRKKGMRQHEDVEGPYFEFEPDSALVFLKEIGEL